MREALFIQRNVRKWKEYEYMVSMGEDQSPDDLADMYTDLAADLAFAQTHYPESRITAYLNYLTLELHTLIYRTRREKWSRLRTFWTQEVPLAVYQGRREMLAALVFFLLMLAVGVYSVLSDGEFANIMLGDYYVDMTIENIEKGKPTGVYDSHGEVISFWYIAFNNLKCDAIAFALGLFTPIGSAFYLMNNGVMTGAFTAFFARYNVFHEAFLAIMQHGTIEISTMAIAGGSGFILGCGWLFPGTYTRRRSFLLAAKRGMKVAVSLFPFTIVAAFLESFVTRHTELPDALRWTVIIASAGFVFYYYVYLPYRVGKASGATDAPQAQNPATSPVE